MTNKRIDIKHPKLRGEWAELRFMARAAEHGLRVSKPWGDTARYDFAVEHETQFLRVQVKSTICKYKKGYFLAVHGSKGSYAAGDFDFVAAYIIPLDVWFILPCAVAMRGPRLLLSPEYRK